MYTCFVTTTILESFSSSYPNIEGNFLDSKVQLNFIVIAMYVLTDFHFIYKVVFKINYS